MRIPERRLATCNCRNAARVTKLGGAVELVAAGSLPNDGKVDRGRALKFFSQRKLGSFHQIPPCSVLDRWEQKAFPSQI